MEQKLAEFRARRQAENAVRKDKSAGVESTEQSVAAHPETSASDSQQTEQEAENSRNSPNKVRYDSARELH